MSTETLRVAEEFKRLYHEQCAQIAKFETYLTDAQEAFKRLEALVSLAALSRAEYIDTPIFAQCLELHLEALDVGLFELQQCINPSN